MNCKNCKRLDKFGFCTILTINKQRRVVDKIKGENRTAVVYCMDNRITPQEEAFMPPSDFGCKHFESKEPFKAKF